MSDAPFFDLRNLDTDGKRALLDRLKAWRACAKPDELAGTILRLGDRYISRDLEETKLEPRRKDFIECRQHPCAHFDYPPSRSVPTSFGKAHDAIRILQPLPHRTGPGLLSQVYVGTFELDPSSSDRDVQEVIVKIYQMSMYEGVLKIDLSSTSRWELECQWGTMASGQDEEWAYRKMISLQGSIIPRAYGFFQVMLPHGEPSVAFIMEKIDSVPYPTITKRLLERYDGTDEAGEALKSVVYTLLAADHAVHTCGITSLDEDGLARNLLWQRDSYMAGTAVPGASFPVLIDFGFVAPLPAASYRSLAFQRAVLVLRALDFGEDLIEAWLESLTESPDVEDAPVVQRLDGSLSYEAQLLRLFDVPYERAKRYPGMLEWW